VLVSSYALCSATASYFIRLLIVYIADIIFYVVIL